MLQLAWLYWNPERVAFHIPFVDHPVVWYGVCFVFGFVVGYFLLIPLFVKFLSRNSKITERDISNWPLLVHLLQQKGLVSKIKTSHANTQKIDSNLKNTLLKAVNKLNLDRDLLVLSLPGAIFRLRDIATLLVDRLTWFVVTGTIIGARLGHVFFYEWPKYQNNLSDIYKVWKGGLASHGAAVGILFSLWIYQRVIRKHFPDFTFINLLDIVAIPTAFIAFCIRFGNFINQEILGTPTTVPWAIIFGDPADASAIVPRHPVQLYEAAAYLIVFGFLYYLWKKHGNALRPGVLSGLFLILVFSARFGLEFFKTSQSIVFNEVYLQTGQYLSIPFILAGFFLYFYGKYYSLTQAQDKPQDKLDGPLLH